MYDNWIRCFSINYMNYCRTVSEKCNVTSLDKNVLHCKPKIHKQNNNIKNKILIEYKTNNVTELASVPMASVLKFLTVFGTVFPNSPTTMRPVFSPPISISKNTFNIQQHTTIIHLYQQQHTAPRLVSGNYQYFKLLLSKSMKYTMHEELNVLEP